jgi:hypothetical protein
MPAHTLSSIPAKNCQSCGMDLRDRRYWGTDKANVQVDTYCISCFQGGRFTEPKLTLEEMSWRIHRLLVQQGGVPAIEAASIIDGFLPNLKRWREDGP